METFLHMYNFKDSPFFLVHKYTAYLSHFLKENKELMDLPYNMNSWWGMKYINNILKEVKGQIKNKEILFWTILVYYLFE